MQEVEYKRSDCICEEEVDGSRGLGIEEDVVHCRRRGAVVSGRC